MIDRIEDKTTALVQQLLKHPLYQIIDSEAAVRAFMEQHVYCVWDFQSLLFAVRNEICGNSLPWRPSADPQSRRLINEIILGEESDIHPDGGYASHFELYLDAMNKAGADTGGIKCFIDSLQEGLTVEQAAGNASLPAAVCDFLKVTFDCIEAGRAHSICSFFTFGREDLIPDVFRSIVAALHEHNPDWSLLNFYLERHIEVDEGEHGPAAHKIIKNLCQDDPRLVQECVDSAVTALEARLKLWDAIHDSLQVAAL